MRAGCPAALCMQVHAAALRSTWRRPAASTQQHVQQHKQRARSSSH